jgi:hypothetical protein
MEVEKPIFSVIKWNAVASWVSDSVSLTCSICRESLDAICPHCMLLSDPNIVCHIAKGQCGHSFHKHCLDRWFSSQKNQNCLLCSATWNPL